MASISRRRLLIAGAAAGLTFATGAAAGSAPPVVLRWRGSTLGAQAEILLLHPDRAAAGRLLADCLEEIERLEGIFSLYRRDSAMVELNRQGQLEAPPLDLLVLLAEALELAEQSKGAFDPSVQPLFALYARHFAARPFDRAGPSQSAIRSARRLVDYRRIGLEAGRIVLSQPGMALTLNGIAQGYITDRVTERLRAAGVKDVLVSLGELRALGCGPNGQAWRVELDAPARPQELKHGLLLGEGPRCLPALATSGGYGTPFEASGRHHHLLDPHSGVSANEHAAVSVAAATATRADGLSTALAVLSRPEGAALLARFPEARAWYRERA